LTANQNQTDFKR